MNSFLLVTFVLSNKQIIEFQHSAYSLFKKDEKKQALFPE